ncbi:MAG: hypothetical protein JWL64_2395 [Frankiales bacterium]|nr:hypothetical protein [Frankiales bacterium]
MGRVTNGAPGRTDVVVLGLLEAGDERLLLLDEGLRHVVAELREVVRDQRRLLLPDVDVDREQQVEVTVGDVEVVQV